MISVLVLFSCESLNNSLETIGEYFSVDQVVKMVCNLNYNESVLFSRELYKKTEKKQFTTSILEEEDIVNDKGEEKFLRASHAFKQLDPHKKKEFWDKLSTINKKVDEQKKLSQEKKDKNYFSITTQKKRKKSI